MPFSWIWFSYLSQTKPLYCWHCWTQRTQCFFYSSNRTKKNPQYFVGWSSCDRMIEISGWGIHRAYLDIRQTFLSLNFIKSTDYVNQLWIFTRCYVTATSTGVSKMLFYWEWNWVQVHPYIQTCENVSAVGTGNGRTVMAWEGAAGLSVV